MNRKIVPKIVAIVGPTASGKSELAVNLALKFDGEVISADSRQVYKELNAGSGKITKSEMRGVPHYLLDVASLTDKELFSLTKYLSLAKKIIKDIIKRGKLPIIVGGTGLYVTALLEGYRIPAVPPNKKLRQKLEGLPLEKLQDTYQKLDPEGFKKIDINNPRRLIRAIEVVKFIKKPFFEQRKKEAVNFKYLVLGLDVPWGDLRKKITKRLKARYPAMQKEIKNLLKESIPAGKIESLGLEQKWVTKILKGEAAESEGLKKLEQEIIDYARRQLTWWRKRDVIWIKSYQEAKKEIEKFLS